MRHVQTGNMLDVVVDGKAIGLKQRDSTHRDYETIWLPEPENVAMVILAELRRTSTPSAAVDPLATPETLPRALTESELLSEILRIVRELRKMAPTV